MTLEKIRAALPTHIMLTPGKIVIKDGDQVYCEDKITQTWAQPHKHLIGSLVPDGPLKPWRRPIPPHILDNQAFYAWLDSLTHQPPPIPDGPKYISEGRLYDKWLLEQMEDL